MKRTWESDSEDERLSPKKQVKANKTLLIRFIDNHVGLSATFNDPDSFTDLELYFTHSNLTLYVHKIIVVSQSDYFKKMSNGKDESKRRVYRRVRRSCYYDKACEINVHWRD